MELVGDIGLGKRRVRGAEEEFLSYLVRFVRLGSEDCVIRKLGHGSHI